MARAEGELRDVNKALEEVVKEADTMTQQKENMHTEKRIRDKKLRDVQVSERVRRRGGMLQVEVASSDCYYGVEPYCRMPLKR